jgi:hypothetical protein
MLSRFHESNFARICMGILFFVVLCFQWVTAAISHIPAQTGRRVEVEGFSTPESVSVGPDGLYYVSNIGRTGTDGDGSIRVISGDPFAGTATVSDLATGLDNPAGTSFVGTDLFVTDGTRVWKIETAGERRGEKSVFLTPDSFPRGPGMLNDVAADSNGHLYISDTDEGVIFKANPMGQVSLFLDVGPMNPLRRPNGVIVDSEGLISGAAGSVLAVGITGGNLIAIASDGGSTQVIASRFGLTIGDGLAFDRQGRLYIGDFRGRVYRMMTDRSIERILAGLTTPADLTVDQQKGWLVIPSFTDDKVSFVELQ